VPQQVGLSAIVTPELDDRAVSSEVKDLEAKVSEATNANVDLESSGLDEQIQVEAEGAGMDAGGGGGLTRVALAGATGAGLLAGLSSLADGFAPRFSKSLDLVWQGLGMIASELLEPIADVISGPAKAFFEVGKTAMEDGLGAAAGQASEGTGEFVLEKVGLGDLIKDSSLEQVVGTASLLTLIGGTVAASSFLSGLIGKALSASTFLSMLGLGGAAGGGGAAAGAGTSLVGPTAAAGSSGAAAAGSSAASSGGGLIGARGVGAAAGIVGAGVTLGNEGVNMATGGQDLLDLGLRTTEAAAGGEQEREQFRQDFTEDFATTEPIFDQLGLSEGRTSSLLQGQRQMGAASLEAFGGEVGEGAVRGFNERNPNATIGGGPIGSVPDFQERSTLPSGIDTLPDNDVLGDAAGSGLTGADEDNLRDTVDDETQDGNETVEVEVNLTDETSIEERLRAIEQNTANNGVSINEQDLARSNNSAEKTFDNRRDRDNN